MIQFRNRIYSGSNGRKSLFDGTIRRNDGAVIIFVHGYKGFKDWGTWPLMENRFLDEGFGFVKFNMSHNGGTVENSIDFPDLDAFGENRYSYEVADLNTIIGETTRMLRTELNLSLPIYLLGHSRGGGIAIIEGQKNRNISKVVSLAGICDIGSRFPSGEELLLWEQEGIMYVENTRTFQQMPHNYSMYEDFLDHREELNIEKSARKMKIPFLQIHGDMDTSVSISEGMKLAEWTNTQLAIVKGGEHTFGASEPWKKEHLPEDLEKAIGIMLEFFRRTS